MVKCSCGGIVKNWKTICHEDSPDKITVVRLYHCMCGNFFTGYSKYKIIEEEHYDIKKEDGV